MSESILSKAVVDEGLQITTHDLMSKGVDELTLQEAHYVATVLDVIEKVAKKRLEAVKPRLKSIVEKEGVVTEDDKEKGHKTYMPDYGVPLKLQKSVASQPDDEGLKELLTEKKIKISEVYDEVKTLVLNPAKLEFLVQKGLVTNEEIRKLKKEGWSLIIEKPEPVKALLEAATGKKPKR